MEANPGPCDEDADAPGSGAHDPAEHLLKRGNARPAPGRQEFQGDAAEDEPEVPEHRDVVAAHRRSRYQPTASHIANAADLPGCEASSGSVSALMVGCA